jgi:hypothetical protein
MTPAATATAPNDISTLIASDPASRLASAWSRSTPCAVSLPSVTSRVMSRTILMAATLSVEYASTDVAVSSTDLLRMRRNPLLDRQRVRAAAVLAVSVHSPGSARRPPRARFGRWVRSTPTARLSRSGGVHRSDETFFLRVKSAVDLDPPGFKKIEKANTPKS